MTKSTRVIHGYCIFSRWIESRSHAAELEDVIRMHQADEGEAVAPGKTTPGSGKGKGKGKGKKMK